MSKSKNFLFALICALTLVFSPLGLGGASAQSSCKGQAKSACSSSNSCAWVKAFTRKDGVKVKEHCRKKAKSGSSSSSSNSNKSTNKSTNKKDNNKKKNNKKKADKNKPS